MNPEKICDQLKEQFGDLITSTAADSAHPCASVNPDGWVKVATYLRDQMKFNLLRCISGLDLLEANQLVAVYDLMAMRPSANSNDDWQLAAEFAIRVVVNREKPHIPSVATVWPAADWHEREAYDLLGIVFDNHPDTLTDHDGKHPRRILCPDDWVGYPLRKDYLFPMEYHGIPGTTEYQLTSPRH